jgi:hypothetical protein
MIIVVPYRAAQQGGGLRGENHLKMRRPEKGFRRAAGISWSIHVRSGHPRSPAMQRATPPQCKATLWT